MSERNRRFVLRERPAGRIGPGTFELVEEPVPNIVEAEALVRTQWISLDPANRGWIRDAPSYLPPVEIGEVMPGAGPRPCRGLQASMLPRGTAGHRAARLARVDGDP